VHLDRPDLSKPDVMRVLMVTPYPPIRDGIASYALQAVAALRRQQHQVEVLSPGPSAAHHHLDLLGPRGPLVLARRVGDYDKVIIQYHPDIFYPVPSTTLRHAMVSLGLLAVVHAARRSEVVVHEIDHQIGRRRGLDGLAARRLWRRIDRVLLHTEAERQSLVDAFGVPPERTEVIPHGAHFLRRTTMTREAARRSLGIPEGELVFLAIGFIQPHKAFDQAVRAFAGLADNRCSLHIVGSVRIEEPQHLAYLAELGQLVAATPGAHLHDQYVSDEVFDRWLVASDVVVLPYRNIWSSGVLERALLYDREVIATAVGGLGQQAAGRRGVTLVDEAGLAAAMWRASNQAAPRAVVDAWSAPGKPSREQIQEQVVARATRSRGLPVRVGGDALPVAPSRHASLPLQRLPPLGVPAPISARPGVSLLKQLVRRATAWQVDPLVAQVNALRQATIEALEHSAQPDREPPAEAPVEPPAEAEARLGKVR
jgi:glycosyltransferase involved in cell wall biosynthesis